MFGFLFRKKREDVRRILQRSMNRSFLKHFRYGNRLDPRCSFCEVVWVLPCEAGMPGPDFEQAFAAVTKDIAPEGLSLIAQEPFAVERVLIGLPDRPQVHFVLCTVGHSTPMGYGFYQVGLHPEEPMTVHQDDVQELERRLSEHPAARETTAVEMVT